MTLGLKAGESIVRGVAVGGSAKCSLHKYHSPRPQILYLHHVVPLEWGGKDVPSNVILVCPTSHANLMDLKQAWKRGGGKPPWKVLRQYSEAERELAERAWSLA